MIPPALGVEWALKTPLMAAMHEDGTVMRSGVAETLEKFGLPSWRVSYWERLQVCDPCVVVQAVLQASQRALWPHSSFASQVIWRLPPNSVRARY